MNSTTLKSLPVKQNAGLENIQQITTKVKVIMPLIFQIK